LYEAAAYRGKWTRKLVAELPRDREPGLQGIASVLDGFLRRGAVRSASGEIRKGNGITAPLLLRERADFKGVVDSGCLHSATPSFTSRTNFFTYYIDSEAGYVATPFVPMWSGSYFRSGRSCACPGEAAREDPL
jgi:hypothetical protein